LVETIGIDARFNKTFWFVVFLTMACKTSFTRKIEKKFEHEGINVKLTFEAKCSCKWTMAYNLCKYKTPNHLKMVVDHHHFLGGGLCHQKM
jgi:hypothetical protein